MTDLLRVEWPARWEEGAPPTHPGRALNAWLYGEIARADEDLAETLHDDRRAKPLTVALTHSGEPPTLVVTAYGSLADRLATIVPSATRRRRMLLDGCWLEVGNPTMRDDTWAGLAGRWLLQATRAVPVRLEFLTPTTFHSRGRTLPLPVPALVFGGLLARWQEWASLDLGEGARGAIEERAVLARHHLRSEWVQLQGRHAAFRGWADFTLAAPPEGYAGLVTLLSVFAEYAGVGQKTMMGMGCVRARPRSVPAAESHSTPNV